jgi:flagellar protein FlaG
LFYLNGEKDMMDLKCITQMKNQYYEPQVYNDMRQDAEQPEPSTDVMGKLNVLNLQDRASDKLIDDTVKKANKDLVILNTSLKVSIHKGTHEIMVKVMNDKTGEVIREIPAEKTLDMVARILKRTGIIVDVRR